ncbi:MAG TPA: DUF2339 domain-containing protein [Methylomirabilota bacterium]|nr:DUF2339 domain-containing protein [Methylomirabilota bacterium]
MILFFGLVAIVALIVAAWALSRTQGGQSQGQSAEERLAALEEQMRGLLYRVWTLEGAAERAPREVPPAPAAPIGAPAPPPPPQPAPPPGAPATVFPRPQPEPAPPAAAKAPRPAMDLEQRIGARWATWVGIIAIIFAVSFFLKWAFDNNYLGPSARVILGLIVGLAMLLGGLVLHPRRDVPYLSEGLAGGGLAILYLSLYAAHGLFGLAGPGLTFAAMFAVTLLGSLVAVVSSRQITAVLTVVGGLLTPVLITMEEPDERKLLAYLIVLNLLVAFVARFRTWPWVNRLAWAGTALLFLGSWVRDPDAPQPLTRLALLSALFLLFLAVPLFRERVLGQREREIDLLLVVANAAGYFWAVFVTLDSWRPNVEGPYALALAVVYRLVAADCAERVPEDEATVVVHEGISWTFLTLTMPLVFDGKWVTLAWAVQGTMLLWTASRMLTPVAAWGGLAALLLATIRALVMDRYWYPDATPVWNLTFLVHLVVVAALAWGGRLASHARPQGLRVLTVEGLRSILWFVAVLLLAELFWREPSGLWPATLLTAEVVVLGWIARASTSPAFLVATPLVTAILFARTLGADDGLARRAAESLLNWPLLSRAVACAACGVAGASLARSPASVYAAQAGRALSGAAGVILLFVLSANWTRYQNVGLREAQGLRQFDLVGQIRWQTQVGLSVLWTLYAAAALAWGFIRSRPAVRYAALGLFGLTVFKVFLVDLAAVKTVYRILSFLVLGVVLLLVSLVYQKARRPVPPTSV